MCTGLTQREQNLIKELREVPHGEVTVYMMDGQPIRIVVTKESKKL